MRKILPFLCQGYSPTVHFERRIIPHTQTYISLRRYTAATEWRRSLL